MGREISIKSTHRIISIVPSQTELLIDLGLKDQLVGITKFCVHPKDLRKEIAIVGGTKQLDIDKIRSLKPDLIIANKEENLRDQIEVLSKEFPVWISDINNLEDAWEMISALGKVLNREEECHNIIVSGKSKWQSLFSKNEKGSCLYFIWNHPYMLAGKDTFINAVLSHLGYNNLALSLDSRYPEINTEQIKELNPEYIFLSSEPYPFKEKNKRFLEGEFPESKIHLVDGEFFSWYGSRLIPAANYFKEFLK